ncbi:M28 family peptidase [Sphaerobacter sp.]|uniref:M28 family peptidase n=1 Tax=Sphaerobacter sp. TaxID=2099654 RepID=UPI001D4620BB|nr:M28 family peptidase [Sphaerobacter sp.]MBX5445151.1 M28 family peptidase [Sphaerobacter sp.]
MVESISRAVSGAELDRHLRAIAQYVRLSGTPDEAKAFDYIQEQLERFGYTITRYESDALIGYPGESRLEILGTEPEVIPSNGYSLSPQTEDDGVVGELVYVGAGLPADYAGRDVRGKIVLSDGLAMPGKTLAAQQAGAIGQIHVNDEHIHQMCISPVWGTATPETADLLPKVPSVSVDRAGGERLKAALARGPVQVRLMTKPYRAWCKIPTLIADLPGTVEDRFVLFSGHVDSWHYGAMDNGTANATQLEVARLLAERRGELRRGVRLAFWSGHSHGRYAGSTWYADTFWHELHERCVCHVNIDSVGAKGAEVLDEAPSMAETYAFGREILRDTVGVELVYRRISRSSDQSFWGHGIPTLFASLSEQAADASATAQALGQLLGSGRRAGGLGWWWHTTEDTLDKIDPDNLVRDAGVYAETLWRLCTVERLPFDFAAAADEIAEAVSGYHEAANGAIDLSRTADEARRLAATLRATPLDQRDPDEVNDLLMDLSRLLIPVNYTRSGPFEHDLALGTVPVPGLAQAAELARLDPASDEFRFLHAKLVRERNRVEHALRAAHRRVAGAWPGAR